LSTTAYRVTAAVTFAGMLAGLLASILILLETHLATLMRWQ
jgi:hypothetical protein